MRPSFFFFVLLILTSISIDSPYAFSKPRYTSDFTKDGLPNIQSNAAFIIEWPAGIPLFDKNADDVRPIASLSKMMAALVIYQDCNLHPEFLHTMTVSNREAAKGGDKTKLTTGWSYSHQDLLKAALMRSDNRALPALAEACGLTPQDLAAKMTEKALFLGLVHTKFAEPTGLSPENVSTAREVAQILREILKIKDLTDIMTEDESTITAYRGSLKRQIRIRNTDRLLKQENIQVIGGKTGYTDLARYCLAVAIKTEDNQDVGMVFLGAEGKDTRYGDFSRAHRWLSYVSLIPSTTH